MQQAARLHSPGERLNEEGKAVLGLCAQRGGLLTRRLRGRRQPSALIECECLIADIDMIAEPVDLARDPVEPAVEFRLEPSGPVRREKGRDRRFRPLATAAGEEVDLVGEDLGAVAGNPVLVLPLGVVDAALDGDQLALRTVLADGLGEAVKQVTRFNSLSLAV